MPKYDKKRIARLFDDMTDTRNTTGGQIARSGENVPQIAGQVAFEYLELTGEDVLLDVGTGTGDKAIAAAHICRQVIGIDISKRSLERARIKAKQENIVNVIFAYGEFENPCTELDLFSYGITKILAIYSLHHLPDPLKRKSLSALAELMRHPGRIVIGDIMFFDDPEKHSERFDEVHYDAGDTDFPSRVPFLIKCFKRLGAIVRVLQLHPLVGVIIADFV